MEDKYVSKLVLTGEKLTVFGGHLWPLLPEGWEPAWMYKDDVGTYIFTGTCLIAGQTWTNCIAQWNGKQWEIVGANGQAVFSC